jgi:hypothetical protein
MASPSIKDRSWDACIAALTELYGLEDDWDGRGAPAPNPLLLGAALRLAQHLQASGYRAPDRVLPGPTGTVILEWQMEGPYREVEVVETSKARVTEIALGCKPRCEELIWDNTGLRTTNGPGRG